jgi:hypothetical protein
MERSFGDRQEAGPMPDLYKLRQEHAELVGIVERLSAVIDLAHPPAMGDLFTLRHELSFTLISHLKAEDWVLYPRLFASDDPQVALRAQEFSFEMGGLADAYVDYADRWNAHSIEADWRGYCAETRCILEALTNRITRENRDLYPMLELLDKAA